MYKTNRRTFIRHGIIGGTISLFTRSVYALRPTATEIEGPFYPVVAQKDKDFDLTKIEGQQGVAKGKIIMVQGRILDTDGSAIENATIDLWQANSAGRYRHPHDANQAPLDSNFQGWAIVFSGKNGVFRFKTIYPGSYPASATWTRPPHIHFKVSKNGYIEIVTQMYFPGHELNNTDRLLQRKRKEDSDLMIASKINEVPETYEYKIVLQKV